MIRKFLWIKYCNIGSYNFLKWWNCLATIFFSLLGFSPPIYILKSPKYDNLVICSYNCRSLNVAWRELPSPSIKNIAMVMAFFKLYWFKNLTRGSLVVMKLTGFCNRPAKYNECHSLRSINADLLEITPYLTNFSLILIKGLKYIPLVPWTFLINRNDLIE